MQETALYPAAKIVKEKTSATYVTNFSNIDQAVAVLRLLLKVKSMTYMVKVNNVFLWFNSVLKGALSSEKMSKQVQRNSSNSSLNYSNSISRNKYSNRNYNSSIFSDNIHNNSILDTFTNSDNRKSSILNTIRDTNQSNSSLSRDTITNNNKSNCSILATLTNSSYCNSSKWNTITNKNQNNSSILDAIINPNRIKGSITDTIRNNNHRQSNTHLSNSSILATATNSSGIPLCKPSCCPDPNCTKSTCPVCYDRMRKYPGQCPCVDTGRILSKFCNHNWYIS